VKGKDREGRGGTGEGRNWGWWGGEGRSTWAPPLETSSGSAHGFTMLIVVTPGRTVGMGVGSRGYAGDLTPQLFMWRGY